ncbi:PhnD/SsuA/transferrin family substrate-binding protein [Piscinibacter koreensis]|uniref:PhnD/SsuA/transferrin family substrate-binding protein n=1 Tax=Piscinibacter koreensis TaxID=2742824 RepID=UPI00159220F1
MIGALVAGFGVAPVSAQAPSVVEVQPGDTFSAIAARFTGSANQWRKLYRADRTGLANPNRITVGMRFELASDARGGRYLRLLAPGPHQASADASTRVATGTAPAPATTPAAPAAPATTAAVPAAATSVRDPLVIGVLPNIPAAALTAQYERMQRYLERGGAQKVTIVVPRTFKDFFDATMRGDYDLAVAAPHFARVAQVDRNMIPLVVYQPQINALFVAPNDSKVAGARDVRGAAVGFANPTSLVAMYGQQWLKQAGLEPKTDYEIRPARTDLGVGRMLLSGDAAAAIMSNGEFRALPGDESSRLKVVDVIAKMPNFIIVAHPRIDPNQLNRVKGQLKGFLADPEEGAPFSQASGFTGIVDVDSSTMNELDAFAPATRRAMGVGN